MDTNRQKPPSKSNTYIEEQDFLSRFTIDHNWHLWGREKGKKKGGNNRLKLKELDEYRRDYLKKETKHSTDNVALISYLIGLA